MIIVDNVKSLKKHKVSDEGKILFSFLKSQQRTKTVIGEEIKRTSRNKKQ